jgi:hypothetical protein
MARNRIIYGSQSVWCNGVVLLRVQTLGSTTTFTNEDIFELGHLDIVDVVDDVPAVAVTLNTNDWGDVKTMAVLAQVAQTKLAMDATATDNNANLTVISGTTEVDYLHGVSLADFAVTCGTLTGVSIWAPVQDECSLGDYLTDDIDQTMYMDEVYINSLEFSYTTGANATENYAAETDQKMWLLNDGRFVNYEDWTGDAWGAGFKVLDIENGSGGPFYVVTLSDGTLGFLRTDVNGARSVTVYDVSEDEATNYEVITWAAAGSAADATRFVYNIADNNLYKPTGLVIDAADRVEAIYAADGYGTFIEMHYFRALQDLKDSSVAGADERIDIGALRQGQVEVYIVDPGSAQAGDTGDAELDNAWRLSACTITCDLTREPLTELGHLGPYDRPLTLPIPITVTVDSTAGDLELWARFAKQQVAYEAGDLDDISLADLLSVENLLLVVKVFAQTDEEAGGTGANRKVSDSSFLVGEPFFNDGTLGAYSGSNEQEWALKTIVVEHLKMTDEAYTLDLGTNATQTYGFRSTNDLYVVKGDIQFDDLKYPHRIRRNS